MDSLKNHVTGPRHQSIRRKAKEHSRMRMGPTPITVSRNGQFLMILFIPIHFMFVCLLVS